MFDEPLGFDNFFCIYVIYPDFVEILREKDKIINRETEKERKFELVRLHGGKVI